MDNANKQKFTREIWSLDIGNRIFERGDLIYIKPGTHPHLIEKKIIKKLLPNTIMTKIEGVKFGVTNW